LKHFISGPGGGEAFCSDIHPVEKTIEDIMECPEDAEFYLNCHGDIILGVTDHTKTRINTGFATFQNFMNAFPRSPHKIIFYFF
jgi:hypothetical protein